MHNEVTKRVFKDIFNIDAELIEIDFAGKSTTDNLHELAMLKQIPEDIFQRKSEKLLQSYKTVFSKSMPQNAAKNILSGAKELLDELSKKDHIIVLYTGNPKEIVDAVFAVTDLGKYFKFCFYGTEVETRADMVKLALRKAKEITGRDFENKEIVIVGDSTRDVECGKLFNPSQLP